METGRVDVLIVDDDEAIRAMLRQSLRRRGLECAEAQNGLEALQLLRRTDCSVILLDLGMPLMDGFAFAEAFLRDRRPGQHPVIFAMSAAGEDQLRRCEADSVHAIVRKPFDVVALAEIVERCVASRKDGEGSHSARGADPAPRNV